jgi:alkanesulfonate monooxygenase SsuD/methylene tetrahydromethanopterin reductase-like flavin-dependent oxidoreductase (luciferase family)
MPRFGAVLPLHSLAPGLRVAYIQQAEASGYEGIWVPKGMGPAAFTVLATAAQVIQRWRPGRV